MKHCILSGTEIFSTVSANLCELGVESLFGIFHAENREKDAEFADVYQITSNKNYVDFRIVVRTTKPDRQKCGTYHILLKLSVLSGTKRSLPPLQKSL